MKRNILITGSLAALVIAGAAITLIDYKQWWHAEWDKFGQGYPDTRKPALVLDNNYENKWGGVRLRYPGVWQVKELKTVVPGGKFFDQEAVREKWVKLAEWEGKMELTIKESPLDMADLVKEKKSEITKWGTLVREPEGVQMETAEGMVLTWNEGKTRYQEVLAKSGNKVIGIRVYSEEAEWKNWEKTWQEIFKSLVVY